MLFSLSGPRASLARPPTAQPQDKPRLLIVGPFPPPFGGIANVAHQLLHSSLRTDFNLGHVDVSHPSRVVEAVSERHNLGLWNAARATVGLLRAVITHRPHIVLLEMSGDISCFREFAFALIARTFARCRVVVHFHGDYHTRARSFPFVKARKSTIASRALVNLCFLPAHRIVFLSDGIAQQFTDVLAARNSYKACVVENFVDCSAFGSHLPSDGNVHVLFVGRLSKAKGFFDLLSVIPEVLATDPNTVFDVCGSAEHDDALSPVADALSRLEQGGSLQMHGVVSGEAKQQVFSMADIMVHPSRDDVFPVTILEGLAQGLPIVATAMGVVPSCVTDGVNGFLIRAGDTEALKDRLVWLLDRPEMRQDMGARNAQQALDRFDLAVAEENFRSIFIEELSRARGRQG